MAKKESKKPEPKVEKKPEPLRTAKPQGFPDVKAGDWIVYKKKRGKVFEITPGRAILAMEDGSEFVVTDRDLDNLERA